MKKVFVLGIDGASPDLVFKDWLDDLPNIKTLIKNGNSAILNSTIPPLTIIAWTSFVSGKDPSEINIHSYTINNRLVSSNDIKVKRIWEIFKGKSILLNIPLTYPVKPINGLIISDFLTPDITTNCAYPENLKEKIKSLGNTEFFFDVTAGLANHKSLDIDQLLKRTYEMTDMQFKLIKDLIKEDWSFFMAVLIGTDRLQHMLWRHFDTSHRRFIKNSKYKNALKEFYVYIDKNLGEILKLLDKNTIVIVASDHGMIKQEGKININNWLIKNNYLTLKKPITEKTRFNTSLIDFKKTRAYASGAYHARIYLRDKSIKEEIVKKLKEIKSDTNKELNTKIFETQKIYKSNSNPECPDLIVYFDNLSWASNPDLGLNGLYSWETAVGADNAGHSSKGILIISKKILNKEEIDIQEVAPLILNLLGEKNALL